MSTGWEVIQLEDDVLRLTRMLDDLGRRPGADSAARERYRRSVATELAFVEGRLAELRAWALAQETTA